MRNLILHGDNQAASRDALTHEIEKYKEEGYEVLRLDHPDKKTFIDAVSAQMLFANKKLVVIENFLSTQNNSMELLLTTPTDTELLLWEKKPLTPTQVKKLLTKFNVREFKIPTSVFQFLDSLTPGNTKRMLELFKTSMETQEAEFLFTMFTRQLRLLLWAKFDPGSLKVPGWQKSKLVSQAEKFTKEQLFDLHTMLLEIDRANKTSKFPENLSASIELLLVSI